ncbi:methionine ABC transporter substrate-binding protein [Corynebacterium sp. TAE3-ERU12]|uniref:MetQ/NlpA family ABC transporter substrate-binding protein n=1 Tax=Corynebacterium sp. TAE3-ERU12 TaxID=2849491 RepID=UPI001C4691EF|nr:MetQ/NlpA family ABC transporter substrate-binding protein [Corynebacterium sp. TAE3-ERU12]MBV7294740.1 methionine ABC transporter substrate-binding protein [Corynebacterium sp. TAE3-ERU12]
MNLRRIAATSAALAVTAAGLVACGSDEPEALAEGDTIRIGTTDREKEAWSVFEEKADDAGIDLDVVEFAEYPPVNTALSEGELDVNLFQHLKYLAQYNVGANENLVPIGSTEIVPLALFWKGGDSVDEIKKGTEVAIPNDSTNQGRAINVLASAGLLKLTDDSVSNPSPLDIDEDASKVKVTPVDAAQTTLAYGEGKPAIINNTFLDRAGIDPNSSIYEDNPEDPAAEPYINVFVTTEANKDNKDLQTLVKLWHDPEVLAAVERDSRGTSVPVERSPEDLQKILDRAEEDARENPNGE